MHRYSSNAEHLEPCNTNLVNEIESNSQDFTWIIYNLLEFERMPIRYQKHLRLLVLLVSSDKREVSDLEMQPNEERYSWNASPFSAKKDFLGTTDLIVLKRLDFTSLHCKPPEKLQMRLHYIPKMHILPLVCKLQLRNFHSRNTQYVQLYYMNNVTHIQFWVFSWISGLCYHMIKCFLILNSK